MNLLNLIEDTTTGYDNLRALMQASQSGQDAVLNVGGETVTLDPMETRWMFGKYKSFNKAGRQEEFLNHLADPVKFDQHMKQLRQLVDKQKNFRGSVPGQRGVTGDTMPGQMEEDQAVEEIAMQDPNNMTAQTRGKLNWENMIRDYMGNKPYTEFEFSGDRPLTVYRSQVYAILKSFGNMKPQNKVNIILNTFGDKMATVEYLDKLRAKGLMPKKVPAYIPPGTEPTPPGQMDLPGMAAPKIREADDQKKNSKTTELDGAVNPRVARAMQLARARQSAAGTDTEAMVADFVDQQEKDQAEFNKVKSVNQRQDDLLKQVTAVNQQQDREIDSLDSDNADLQNNLQQLQAVNADLAKKLADVGQRRADRQPEPQAPAQPAAVPAEPKAAVEPPLQQPAATATATTAQSAPVKKKKATTRKKSSATKVQRPQQDIPNNVLPFRRPEPAVAQDELSAALQGVDMGNELGTGTYGLKENTETLNVGDPVIISGNVEFNGKTGDVVGFGRDQHFVIVDLYNFGKHAFHASNVEYNNYADEEDTIDEMQTKLDRYNVNQPPPGGTNKQREEFLNARDRLFRQMANASPGEKEAIRLKIAELEGQAQSLGIKIRESDLNEFVTSQAVANDPGLEREKDVDVIFFGRPGKDWQAEDGWNALWEVLPSEYPPGREEAKYKVAEVSKNGGAVVTTKPLSVAKKLVAVFNGYGIKSRINAPGITETDELNRSGYNAIKSLSDWAEKMRVMRELQKDIALMSDPEAKAAVQQRIGDLLKVGIKQGYIKEALNDKAMSVLRSLKQPAQPVAIDLNIPEPVSEPAMDLATVRKRIAQLDELIKMKEQIDRLFVRAQNARGGIYPGLQSDIEDEELYGVPQSDKEYQILKDKYTKDLSALQKFIAMKKAVYRESQEALGESSALVRLKQARQALSQSGMAEAISKKDLLGKLQKDLPKVNDPKNKDAKPVNWTGAGKDDYGYTGYQGHGMPTDKQERDRIRADKKKGVAEGYNSQFKSKEEAVQGAKERVKTFRDHLDGIEIWAMPDGGFDQVHTMNANGRDHVVKNGGKKIGTIYPPKPAWIKEQGVAEGQTDYQKRRQRERDVDAGKPVARQPKNPQSDYARMRAKQKRDQELGEQQMCPKCGGPSFSDLILAEKQDACYHKVRSRYKVWPSAYASGALVQCRKKGAANWGNKKK